MSIGELLQYRQSLFRNRVIYQFEDVISFGSPDQIVMNAASLGVWVQVGRIMPLNEQMMEPIND